MPRVTSTLELGCGTRIWTRELLQTTRRLHVVDSSSHMLALTRRVCGDAVSFDCASIFEWESSQRFDRVVAAFLLSHVPDERLSDFVERVHRWTSTHGEVLLIDEAVPADDESPGGETVRALADGTRYSIVKISRTLEQIRNLFEGAHFRPILEVQAGRLLGIVLKSM